MSQMAFGSSNIIAGNRLKLCLPIAQSGSDPGFTECTEERTSSSVWGFEPNYLPHWELTLAMIVFHPMVLREF